MRKGGTVDVLVVGAGVYGLATALALARAGRSVRVLDWAGVGAGASGSPVGVLAPHSPEGWSPQKALQREALLSAGAYWRGVAREAGFDPEHARLGRLMPLRTPADLARTLMRREAAKARWGPGTWRILTPAEAAAWLAPAACRQGAVFETLTARLAPRRALAALAAALAARGGRIEAPVRVASVRPGLAVLGDGERRRAGLVVVAAGAGTASLVGGITGVKGQALVLVADARTAGGLAGMAVLGDRSLWIVPHADGVVAVGSTSERAWTGEEPDGQGEALLARARALCPCLAGARVAARWAGIRPRGDGGAPVVGWLAPGLLVASGGYKTGFATAPVVADLVARLAVGEDVALPGGIASPDKLTFERDVGWGATRRSTSCS
jgi:glycine oxidase